MPSVPNPNRRPIIDSVAHYHDQACVCGRGLIDVQLVPAIGSPEEPLIDPAVAGSRCDECILAKVPDGRMREDLVRRYNDARMVRRVHGPNSIHMRRLGLEGQRLPTR